MLCKVPPTFESVDEILESSCLPEQSHKTGLKLV